jgi:hypothetical protein
METPKIEFVPPIPPKDEIHSINLDVQVLAAAALLVGPVPSGTALRSKTYLDKIDDACRLVFEYLQVRLAQAREAQLRVSDEHSPGGKEHP